MTPSQPPTPSEGVREEVDCAQSQPSGRASSDDEVSAGRNAPPSGGRDPEIEAFLDGVVGVVEATSFEHHMLWDWNRRRDPPLPWKERLSGYGRNVGWIGDMPVFVSLLTAEVDGHKLLFIHPTSVVVDYRLVDEWLEDNLPPSVRLDGGRLNRTDAQNFHSIFRQRPPAESSASDVPGSVANTAQGNPATDEPSLSTPSLKGERGSEGLELIPELPCGRASADAEVSAGRNAEEPAAGATSADGSGA